MHQNSLIRNSTYILWLFLRPRHAIVFCITFWVMSNVNVLPSMSGGGTNWFSSAKRRGRKRKASLPAGRRHMSCRNNKLVEAERQGQKGKAKSAAKKWVWLNHKKVAAAMRGKIRGKSVAGTEKISWSLMILIRYFIPMLNLWKHNYILSQHFQKVLLIYEGL